MLNRRKSFYKISWVVAAFLILVIMWDIYVLQVQVTWHYILFKAIAVSTFFMMGLFSYKSSKFKGEREQHIFYIIYYLYAFHGLAFVDISYYLAFIEGFGFLTVCLAVSSRGALISSAYGLLLFFSALYLSKEPIYIAQGFSFKPHAAVAVFIFVILSLVMHRHVTMYREELFSLNEKFALIGKQSSFLMHEIKSPLSRMVSKMEELKGNEIVSDIRDDSQRMTSIILGIETLIARPEEFDKTFEKFNWLEIENILYKDFESILAISNIKFKTSNFKSRYIGNKYLLYQMLKNMMTNAYEAIALAREKDALITIDLVHEAKGIHITFTNTKSIIADNEIKHVFDPLFSTKKNLKNKGLGLTFSKNIVEAHSGKIEVSSSGHSVTFDIFLPGRLA